MLVLTALLMGTSFASRVGNASEAAGPAASFG